MNTQKYQIKKNNLKFLSKEKQTIERAIVFILFFQIDFRLVRLFD